MEGRREEAEDLLRGAQAGEDHVVRQDVDRLDQLEDRHKPHVTHLRSPVSVLDFIQGDGGFQQWLKRACVCVCVCRTCAAWPAGMPSEAAAASAAKRLGARWLWTQTSLTASLDGA